MEYGCPSLSQAPLVWISRTISVILILVTIANTYIMSQAREQKVETGRVWESKLKFLPISESLRRQRGRFRPKSVSEGRWCTIGTGAGQNTIHILVRPTHINPYQPISYPPISSWFYQHILVRQPQMRCLGRNAFPGAVSIPLHPARWVFLQVKTKFLKA